LVARTGNPIMYMLKILFTRCKQHQIVRIKQNVDPAAPNTDTVVDILSNSYIWASEVGAGLDFEF